MGDTGPSYPAGKLDVRNSTTLASAGVYQLLPFMVPKVGEQTELGDHEIGKSNGCHSRKNPHLVESITRATLPQQHPPHVGGAPHVANS